MRLIDADALHARFKEIQFSDLNSDELQMVMRIHDMLDNAPTIDAKPVRHGRWMATGEFDEWYAEEHKCSICGGIALGNQDNFCLHCGAKMYE